MLEQLVLEEKSEEEKTKEGLMSTGRFERVEYPSVDEIALASGQDIREDYEKIKSSVQEDNLWMLEALRDYVVTPVIVDKFLSEDERNNWQSAKRKEFPKLIEYLESNKLRGNVITNVLGMKEAVQDDWLDSELKKTYQALYEKYKGIDGVSPGYVNMKIDQKIAYTKEVSDFAKRLYQAIADKLVPKTPK